MKVPNAVVLLGLAVILVWGTAAEDQAVKIGIVDIEQAVSSTAEGRAAREELARKQREAEAEIQPLVDEYKAAEEDLKQKRFVLSEDVLYQKQLDMAQMRNQIETRMKELEGRLQLDSKRLEGPLNKKLSEVIEAAGKEAGFTLILQRGSPGLLYTREALDITDLIIEKYNQKKS
jgi:outer membrane protein